ncbi:hypothetical protein JOE58_001516 [Curtobacterium luteum]|uniref:Uncharacterized protein n=1 Tax=Curtobacterium luteum TaxID=33881 RepID=A0ABS2RTD2_9MICO|nr:hypothetical protein [Curtobacterium luteum]MBM7802265.1 hypothetical protein [Curtobacterium luteum]NUU52370.1 hypothetical protein [Curtobacterium luteum]
MTAPEPGHDPEQADAPEQTDAPERWTVEDAGALNARAAGWMLGATLPTASLLGMLLAPIVSDSWVFVGGPWWSAIGGIVSWVVLVDGVSVLFVLGSAFVTVPVTYAAGRLLERARRPWTQVIVHALLAGTMAAVPAWILGADSLGVTAPISIAAGAAGALARRGQQRRARVVGGRAALGPSA